MELFKIFGTIALRGQEDFERDVDAATSKGKKLSNALGKGLATAAKVGAAAVGAAATAVGALTKQSINAFAEYEQLVGGSQLLFGDAYSFIADKAANAYRTVQMSQNEYLQQVNGFATGLKTALGGNEQAAAELADRIINAEADVVAATGNTQEAVQNAFNGIMKSNYTMLDNLQLGITPTKEGFQEVIDKVNEWNTANGNATKYQIDNLADCQSALVDYIAMQGLAGYAADEATKTITGSISSLKAAWKNLLVGVADDNADFEALTNNLIDTTMNAFHRLKPRIVQAISGIATFASKIMPEVVNLIVANLPLLIDAGTQIITALGGAILQNLPLLISTAIELVTNLVNYLSANTDQFVGAVSQIMLAVSGVLLSSAPQLLAAIGELLAQLIISIFEHLPELLTAVAEIITAIIVSLQAAVNRFSEVAGAWLNAMIDAIRTKMTEFAAAAAEGFAVVQNNALAIFDNIKAGIQEKINAAKETVRNAIEKIKGFFKFEWSLPHLKMPHFSISGSFSLNPPSVPHFGIEWYKKGGILNDPTIFGLNPFSGKAMVGGEAGAEAIAPIDTLKKYVTEAVNDAGSVSLLREIVTILNEFKRSGMPISIDITTEIDGATVARKTYKYNLLEQRNHGTSLINA